MRKVYVFGNPMLEEDSLPLRLLSELRNRMPDIEFVEADSNDMPVEDELIIIDAAQGVRDVVLIEDVRQLDTCKLMSMHEMDLGQTLTLMRVAGLLNEVKIIAVPMEMSPSEALGKVEKILRSI